jgi:tellurium resistance protein TerZ
MVLGKLYKRNDEWKFAAIGDPIRDEKLETTLNTVQANYL